MMQGKRVAVGSGAWVLSLPLLLWLLLALPPALAEEDDAGADFDEAAAAASLPPGVVELAPERLRYLDLELTTAEAALWQPGVHAQAQVLDLAELFRLRERHAEWGMAAQVAAAEQAAAAALSGRLTQLRREGENANLRDLESARSRSQAAAATLARARGAAADVALEARLRWGEVFVPWVEGEAVPELDELWTGALRLLQVDLPAGVSQASAPATLALEPDPGTPFTARLLGAGPSTTRPSNGAGWLYLVPAQGLPVGRTVPVWWPLGQPQAVVELPASAVLWFAGSAWVWRETRAGHFERQQVVLAPAATTDRVRVQGGLEAGTVVVSGGAAQLLSEELRAAIPREDAD